MNSTSPGDAFPDALPASTTLRGGDFVLEGVLGQGGFGITYRATDRGLHRVAAIKEFFPQGSQRVGRDVTAVGHSSGDFDAARERFLAEARTLAQFNHPNIVNVYTIFEENNAAYMVMEFVAGSDLQKITEARGPMAPPAALSVIEQVGAALDVVHGAGMLHLDIKPDNVILDESTPGRQRAVLLDFGLTRKLESATGYATTRLDAFSRFGTAGYAPLEQYSRTAQTGAYTDVYALAATLHFLLTAQAPPDATDRASGTPLPDARSVNGQVSTPVAGALAIALSLETTSRPQTVEAFLDLLRAPDPAQLAEPTPRQQSPQQQAPFPSRPRRNHDDDEFDIDDDDHNETVNDIFDQLFGDPRQQRRKGPFTQRDPYQQPGPFRRPQPMPQQQHPQRDPFGNSPLGNLPGVRISGCGCVPGCFMIAMIFLFFILNLIGAVVSGY